MKYATVCSGIEAPSVAWHPLGWEPVWFSEIEPFPCSVLQHHYPSVPNLGDMTRIHEDERFTRSIGSVDLLCGGTPCQSFSVAGLRKGLDDPRGNLCLTFLGIAERLRPRWLVWENVPGVLSSGDGRDFGAFLGALGQLGYGFSYRVLDAQHFGVPQRRRRVFVVGYLGDWRCAAAVLFERHSLSGDTPPSREAGEGITGTFKACAGSGGWSNSIDHAAAGFMTTGSLASRSSAGGGRGTDFDCSGGVIPQTVGALTDGAHMGGGLTDKTHTPGASFQCWPEVAMPVMERDFKGPGEYRDGGLQNTVVIGGFFSETTHSLRADGFDASEDGTGRGTPLVAQTLRVNTGRNQIETNYLPATYPVNLQIATRHEAMGESTGMGIGDETDPAFTLQRGHSHGVGYGSAVRRLTPRECERLQDFPDDYTLVPHRGKSAADGPRYKALGNSMAVPVVHWIGERIQMVEKLTT